MTTDERLGALAACLLERGWTVRMMPATSTLVASASGCRPAEYVITAGGDHDVEICARLGESRRTVARVVDVDEAVTVMREDTARQRQARLDRVQAATGVAAPSSGGEWR